MTTMIKKKKQRLASTFNAICRGLRPTNHLSIPEIEEQLSKRIVDKNVDHKAAQMQICGELFNTFSGSK